MGANREYKSTVFTKLFSEAGALLELYNALSGANYGADTQIEINTLEDVLFMDMMNDISFTIGDKVVVLIEHQSSVSENLPLRLLLYMARVYEKIIDKKAVYRQKLMTVPKPEFIVLYNGKGEFPDERELRLSDAFREPPDHPEKYGSLDLTVRVLNINAGHNESVIRRSETLQGYVTFIRKVREGVDNGKGLSDAVTEAVKYCEEQQVLQPFLANHASEVVNMLTTEFKMEDAIAVWKEEGFAEGLEKGIEKGLEEGLEKGIEKGLEEGREEGEARVFKLLELGYPLDKVKEILRKEREKPSEGRM